MPALVQSKHVWLAMLPTICILGRHMLHWCKCWLLLSIQLTSISGLTVPSSKIAFAPCSCSCSHRVRGLSLQGTCCSICCCCCATAAAAGPIPHEAPADVLRRADSTLLSVLYATARPRALALSVPEVRFVFKGSCKQCIIHVVYIHSEQEGRGA